MLYGIPDSLFQGVVPPYTSQRNIKANSVHLEENLIRSTIMKSFYGAESITNVGQLYRIVLFILGISLVSSLSVRAQSFVSNVVFKVGSVATPHHVNDLPKRAVYPQLEVAFGAVHWPAVNLSLTGSVFAGGWVDGVSKPTPSPHFVTYSFRSVVYGARGGVILDKAPIPISIWGGFSRHQIYGKYVGGDPCCGFKALRTNNETHNTLDVAIRIEYPVWNSWRVGMEAQSSFHIEGWLNTTRSSFKEISYHGVITYVL